jgi:hypothetical protein
LEDVKEKQHYESNKCQRSKCLEYVHSGPRERKFIESYPSNRGEHFIGEKDSKQQEKQFVELADGFQPIRQCNLVEIQAGIVRGWQIQWHPMKTD